jgi:hypothetical protein
MVAPAAEGLIPSDAGSTTLTHSDLDLIYMQITASADIDDASKCWYQIFVDCAKYLLCFRDSQHDRAQAHIADATKAISLLRAANLDSVPLQIVPCFNSVIACCHSRISQLEPPLSPYSLVSTTTNGIDAQVYPFKSTVLAADSHQPLPGPRQALVSNSAGACSSNHRISSFCSCD